jgi:nitrate/nitrite-specific signal transduction histidine kinase
MKKRVSIFWKILAVVLGTVLVSNLILAYIIYRGYETIISEARSYLPQELLQKTVVNLSNSWIIVFATIIFILGISTLLVILITRGILLPLFNLLEVVSQVKKGNLEVQANINTNDELQDLAEQINEMIVSLKVAKDILEEEKDVLEIRVRARTRELRELADQLEQMNKELEEKVKERTKELQKRVEELEKFHRLTVGRELKMREMKHKIEEMEKEIERLKSEKKQN